MRYVVVVWAALALAGCKSGGDVRIVEPHLAPVTEGPGPGVDLAGRLGAVAHGGVVFSKSEGGPAESSFTRADAVYGALQMGTSLSAWDKKLCDTVTCDYDHGEMMVTLRLDGSDLATTRASFYGKDWQGTEPVGLFAYSDAPGAKSRSGGVFERAYARAMAGMQPGRHEVTVLVYKLNHDDVVIASGSFFVDVE